MLMSMKARVHYNDALFSMTFKVLDPTFVVTDFVYGDATKFIEFDDREFFQLNLRSYILEEYTLDRFVCYCLKKDNIYFFHHSCVFFESGTKSKRSSQWQREGVLSRVY